MSKQIRQIRSLLAAAIIAAAPAALAAMNVVPAFAGGRIP